MRSKQTRSCCFGGRKDSLSQDAFAVESNVRDDERKNNSRAKQTENRLDVAFARRVFSWVGFLSNISLFRDFYSKFDPIHLFQFSPNTAGDNEKFVWERERKTAISSSFRSTSGEASLFSIDTGRATKLCLTNIAVKYIVCYSRVYVCLPLPCSNVMRHHWGSMSTKARWRQRQRCAIIDE